MKRMVALILLGLTPLVGCGSTPKKEISSSDLMDVTKIGDGFNGGIYYIEVHADGGDIPCVVVVVSSGVAIDCDWPMK